MSYEYDDEPIDYDIKVGDLVIVKENTDLLLSTVYSGKVCLVIEMFPDGIGTIFNFELRIVTPEGQQVDVWLHEVRKIRCQTD